MSSKFLPTDSPIAGLKNEDSRQRWELFHRAIAHAKQSNTDAMQQELAGRGDSKSRRPVLTIAK